MLMSIVVLSANRAEAVSPGTHGNGIVTDTSPVNWTPHVLDGYVRSFAEVGNIVVAGGNFSEVTSPNGAIELDRDNIFAFEKGTGAITPFAPNLNGEVYEVLPTGDGQTVWVVGGFTQFAGQSHSRIVKVNITTGQPVAQFNPPNFNGRIHAIALRGDRLYVAGRFLNIGGQSHTLFAALNPTTGAVIPDVNIEFSVPRPNRPDGYLTINSMDVTSDGSRAVMTGNFTVVDGQPRYQIAMLNLTTNPTSLANWHTTDFDDSCSAAFDTYMRDVEISPDGEYFVVATSGAYSGGFFAGTLCDTASRWDFAQTGNDLHPTWINYTGGDTLTATAVTESVVYLGGHQRWQNNPYSGDSEGRGAVVREGLAASDPRSGSTLSWDPGRDRGVGVYGFLVTNEGLWIGSDTDRIAGFQYRARIAFMPLSNGTTMPPDWTGDLPGVVYSTGRDTGTTAQTNQLVRREFTGTAVTDSQTTPGSIPLANVRGAFMVDGKLYMGWDENGIRSFRVMSFDGDFGTPEVIDVNGLDGNVFLGNNISNFQNFDLPNMRGMFYDPATGRMYFTTPLNGATAPRLSYRYFSPESNIVGAVRFNGPADLPGLVWDNVRTMFLVGDRLYLGDVTGNLTRWNWDSAAGTPVVGTGVVVSGPGTDGEDWRARDAFLFVGEGEEPPNVDPTASAEVSCVDGECDFDGSDSIDPDGTIVSWVWDFGDGDSGNGEITSHSYAATGLYEASLTVTDDDGATDVHEFDVDVVVPNVAPVADFTADCSGLTCDFDGSASNDPDGTIVSWVWDFGDGGSGNGEVTEHEYLAGDTYPVSLTVTDNDGAMTTLVENVNVFDPNETTTVAFRAAASANQNSLTPDLDVPGSVQAGDVMVLVATLNSPDPTVTGPAGWTLLGSSSNSGTQTHAWTKVAGSDAGTEVALSLSSRQKTSLHLVAYQDASGVSDFAVDVNSVNGTERTTPVVDVAANGSALVSYWADKSSDNVTGWTLPGGVTERGETVGNGGGRISSAIGDTLNLAAGTAGGLTAVTDSANDRQGAAWSFVLAPAGPPPPPPTGIVAFRAEAQANQNSITPDLDIPGNVQAGDVMVLIATLNNPDTSVTGPAGWTLLNSASNEATQTQAWTKIATGGDAGSEVAVILGEQKKAALILVAYSDASGVSDFAVDVDSVNGNQRTTPAVTAAASGSALISYWADKSSDNVTGWTLPGGVTERGETVGSGGGRIAAAIGDTLNLSAGAAGGLTAVTDSGDDRRGAAWSLIIAPE